MSKEDLVSSIMNELEKSGFPLEIFVVDNVCKNQMKISPNARYSKDGVEREIDVFCSIEDANLDLKRIPLMFTTSLIVECKKSEKPWVFFHPDFLSNFHLLYHAQYVSSLDPYFKNEEGQETIAAFQLEYYKEPLTNMHYHDSSIPQCVSYLEPFRKPEASSDIYRAIQSVSNYVEYAKKSRGDTIEDEGEFSCTMEMFFPVIVFDGNLFVASTTNEKINLTPVSHLLMRMNNDGKIMIVDVVEKNYFCEYLARIKLDHEGIFQTLLKYPYRLEYVDRCFDFFFAKNPDVKQNRTRQKKIKK